MPKLPQQCVHVLGSKILSGNDNGELASAPSLSNIGRGGWRGVDVDERPASLSAGTVVHSVNPTIARVERWRRVAAVAGIVLILTNGPVFLFAKQVLDRRGHWEDPAVWAFFAGAAAAAVVLAVASAFSSFGRSDDTSRSLTAGRARLSPSRLAAQTSSAPWQRLAAVSVAWFALAALASTFWSVDPAATSWRSALYLGLASLAWVIAGLRLNEIAAMLFVVSATAVVSSLATVLLWPDVGLDANGAWRGVYTNRNSLAPLAAISLLTSLRYLLERHQQPPPQSDPGQTICTRPNNPSTGQTTSAEPDDEHSRHPRPNNPAAGQTTSADDLVATRPSEQHRHRDSRTQRPIEPRTGSQTSQGNAVSAGRATRRAAIRTGAVEIGERRHLRNLRATRRAAIRTGAGLMAALSVVTMIGAGSRTAWVALAVAASVASLPAARHRVCVRWSAEAARVFTATASAASASGAVAVTALLWDTPTLAQRREMWGLVFERILERPLVGHGFFTFWDIEELTQHVLLRRGSAHNSLIEIGLGLGLLGTVPFVLIVLLAMRSAGLRVWHHRSVNSWMWAAVVIFVIVVNATESFVLWFSYNWVLLMAAALLPTPSKPPTPDIDASSIPHAAANT